MSRMHSDVVTLASEDDDGISVTILGVEDLAMQKADVVRSVVGGGVGPHHLGIVPNGTGVAPNGLGVVPNGLGVVPNSLGAKKRPAAEEFSIACIACVRKFRRPQDMLRHVSMAHPDEVTDASDDADGISVMNEATVPTGKADVVFVDRSVAEGETLDRGHADGK